MVSRVSLREFADVSAIRWCGCQQQLIATAAPQGARVPDVHAGERGDLRLFRCDPQNGLWQQLYRGYAHDPVCLSGGRYAVHRGAGLTLLDQHGVVMREVKVGRFNWGPPALSVGPDGATVAWIHRTGDRSTLCVAGVGPGALTQFRTSAYRYAWLDAGTLVYLFGARPRLLDVSSGATRPFGTGLRAHVRRGSVIGATDQLQALAELAAAQLWEIYGEIQVVGADVWFTATVTEQCGPRRVDGLFRTDAAGETLHLVATMAPDDRVDGFLALPDRSVHLFLATYAGTTVVDRRRAAAGPMRDFLSAGWSPMLTGRQAVFGVHWL